MAHAVPGLGNLDDKPWHLLSFHHLPNQSHSSDWAPVQKFFSIITDWTHKIGAKRAKTCVQSVVLLYACISTELPFLHTTIVGWVPSLPSSIRNALLVSPFYCADAIKTHTQKKPLHHFFVVAVAPISFPPPWYIQGFLTHGSRTPTMWGIMRRNK